MPAVLNDLETSVTDTGREGDEIAEDLRVNSDWLGHRSCKEMAQPCGVDVDSLVFWRNELLRFAVDKSAAIREAHAAKPDAGPSELVAALAEQHIKVTPQLVSIVLSFSCLLPMGRKKGFVAGSVTSPRMGSPQSTSAAGHFSACRHGHNAMEVPHATCAALHSQSNPIACLSATVS